MFNFKELIQLLKELNRRIGFLVEEDEVNLIEESTKQIIVDSESLSIERVSEIEDLDKKFWGLDASIRVLKLSGIDVFICTGALIGKEIITIPGVVSTKWIGIRPRYVVDEDTKTLILNFNKNFYVKSRFLPDVFDGKFNEDVIRDEIRLTIENELIKYWNREDYLIIDGPLFPLPQIITKTESRYSKIYQELVKERINIIKSLGIEDRVIAVVKRLSKSKYLSKIFKYGSTDEHIAITLSLGKGDNVFIGPIKICLRINDVEFCKYAGYIVKQIGSIRHVVRIESFNEDLLIEYVPYISSLIDINGLPKPITLADKICKKLASSVYTLIWGISPIEPTYEAYEQLQEVLKYLES